MTVAPPDFAKNTDTAQDFVYRTGLNFLRHFFLCKKFPVLVADFNDIHVQFTNHKKENGWADLLNILMD